MQIIDQIPIFGSPVDEGALSQIRTCALTASKVALMADHHKGYAVPIGGVVAYEDAISPSGDTIPGHAERSGEPKKVTRIVDTLSR